MAMPSRSCMFGTGFTVVFLLAFGLLIACFTYKNSEAIIEPDVFEGPFWQSSVVYQIYPRSFFDSSADGIGDLRGIASKSAYLHSLGVGVVWISPIFPSPMKDFGYDISDYEDIDPIFGDLDDFDRMIYDLHRRGIRVVLDFVPNHSSDQHEWFVESKKGDEFYKDFYIWKDCGNSAGGQNPPNNWLSAFSGSAWEWDDGRQEFYFHQYLKEQPDLNYRNPDVIEAMEDVLRFWLDRGVDGFRIDAIIKLFEVENPCGANEPINPASGESDPNEYDYLFHNYTANQPEIFDVLRKWRKVIDEYSDKFLMVEVSDDTIEETMKYYGNDSDILADFPFNFFVIKSFENRNDVTGTALKSMVDLWVDNMPEGMWPNWVLGSHDVGRVSTRLGADLVDSMNMFSLLLPGTPVTYYGEEIGMEDTWISYEDTQDPNGVSHGPDHYQEYSRDPERTPLQWDSSKFAGFTNGTDTWLPVNENYVTVNIELQTKDWESSLQIYKRLVTTRKELVFLKGQLAFPLVTEQILSFIRFLPDGDRYLIVINTSEEEESVDFNENNNFNLPEEGEIVIRSSTDRRNETLPGSIVHMSHVSLLAGEALLIKPIEEGGEE